MMLASLGLVVATACDKNDTEPPKVDEISLSVSGGTEVTVTDGDVTKDITVTASAKAVRDIVVTLSSPAIGEGDASFVSSTITIKQGETSAVGKIVFPLSKFPEGADAKKITVTIATSTEGITLAVASTEFTVKGNGGKDMPKLTITANGTEFDTTDGAKTISLTCTLSEVLTEALPITLTLGSETSENIKAMFPEIPQIIIAAGQTTFALPFEMPQGTVGKIVANFAISNDKVTLETQTLTAVFVVNEPEINPTFTLETTQVGDVVVPATGDMVIPFTVKLSKAAEEEQVINLSASKGVLSASSVTFAAGETNKDVTITFLSSEFTSDAVTADVVITGSSQVLEATQSTINLKVKGAVSETSKQNLDYYLASDTGNKVLFVGNAQTQTHTLYVRTESASQIGDIHLNIAVSGENVTSADYSLPSTVLTVTAETKFFRFDLTVNRSALNKTLVVTITSDETTILKDLGSRSYPVVLSVPPQSPYAYGFDYTSNGQKNITVTKSVNDSWISIDLKTAVSPIETVFVTPVITGGLSLENFTGISDMKILNSSFQVWTKIANFDDLPDGTIGTLSFVSDYTTFAENGNITFTVSK